MNEILILRPDVADMKMPVLADLRRTQQELSLALAELDNIEAAVTSMDRPGPGAGDQGATSQVGKTIDIHSIRTCA